ncbi:MAG: hypothetical protein NTY12_00405 [Candidatus Falkowbacteria bacterium]|nr:hypothetical protein [Candidatus Falkowbacteria bacterium]
MALPGTHIRAALELKDKLIVSDLKPYLSGTVYPDSRYATKLSRDLTHSEEYTKKSFYENSDFKKGWAVHQLYDESQYEAFINNLGFLFSSTEPILDNFSDDWLTLTALKVVQDILDIQTFPIKDYLCCLDYVECPNNEIEEDLKDYNAGIVKMYKSLPTQPTDYYSRFTFLKFKPGLIDKLLKRAEEFSVNQIIMEKLKNIFTETIKKIPLA